ncbi:hypothetical protein BCR41DRAFT_372362 [Lobosporangium transversale]|uniref:Uncharacterized protein n=1 Tax=Lobosporangium transversale TaxID=64571 RepID=A0A1Y2GL22_9FUNG|nr:hypothetical protein BCR41DRAFT_372362 [Lobosporangium transversale]ORZ10621.1 hypothetical protein BCR41DRAFT_372362 [Lobosporangium transversale]|eukprot:XP_021879342.1 hypothetical protein BCR41DRAFT_372362 [Lobosporangium transversale]
MGASWSIIIEWIVASVGVDPLLEPVCTSHSVKPDTFLRPWFCHLHFVQFSALDEPTTTGAEGSLPGEKEYLRYRCLLANQYMVIAGLVLDQAGFFRCMYRFSLPSLVPSGSVCAGLYTFDRLNHYSLNMEPKTSFLAVSLFSTFKTTSSINVLLVTAHLESWRLQKLLMVTVSLRSG